MTLSYSFKVIRLFQAFLNAILYNSAAVNSISTDRARRAVSRSAKAELLVNFIAPSGKVAPPGESHQRRVFIDESQSGHSLLLKFAKSEQIVSSILTTWTINFIGSVSPSLAHPVRTQIVLHTCRELVIVSCE